MDLKQEEAALRKANDDIAAAQERIERQEALIAELATHGHDTSAASQLLTAMRGTLEAMVDHRNTITAVIAKIRRGQI